MKSMSRDGLASKPLLLQFRCLLLILHHLSWSAKCFQFFFLLTSILFFHKLSNLWAKSHHHLLLYLLINVIADPHFVDHVCTSLPSPRKLPVRDQDEANYMLFPIPPSYSPVSTSSETVLITEKVQDVGPRSHKRIRQGQNIDLCNRFLFPARSLDLVVDQFLLTAIDWLTAIDCVGRGNPYKYKDNTKGT